MAADPKDTATAQPALLLLFTPGRRPDVRGIRAAVAHSERASISAILDHGPVELLIDGATFDISGLRPDEPWPVPDFSKCVGFDEDVDVDAFEAVSLSPGPHLASGANSAPIVKAQFELVCELTRGLRHLTAVGWVPSKCLLGSAYFQQAVRGWMDGGPFPASALVDFQTTPGGGHQSAGLAYFTGQELRLEPALAADQDRAAPLAMRLASQLFAFGTLNEPQIVTAPDSGNLWLQPSADGRFIDVQIV